MLKPQLLNMKVPNFHQNWTQVYKTQKCQKVNFAKSGRKLTLILSRRYLKKNNPKHNFLYLGVLLEVR